MAFATTNSSLGSLLTHGNRTLFNSMRSKRPRNLFRPASCCAGESLILTKIRENTTKKLQAQNIGIQEMVWKQGQLKVCVTSLEDLEGVPDCKGASIDDCAFASTVISEFLDANEDIIDANYTLEVTTPGTKDVLTKDREFEVFKGFPVKVTTTALVKGRSEFSGSLCDRSDAVVKLAIKGRVVTIPRDLVQEVRLTSE